MSDSLGPMDYSLPGSSVHGILQARMLKWVAIPFSRESSWPRDWTWVPCIARQILYHLSHQGIILTLTELGRSAILGTWFFFTRNISRPIYFPISSLSFYYLIKWSEVKVTQSRPTLCNPMDCGLPGFSVHGILQARILEWIAIPFSMGSSQLRDQTQLSRTAGVFLTIWATRESRITSYKSVISIEINQVHYTKLSCLNLFNNIPAEVKNWEHSVSLDKWLTYPLSFLHLYPSPGVSFSILSRKI